MFEKIEKYIGDKDKILLAVSGGPDSMALLDQVRRLSENRDFLFAVAHVNYHLREESNLEEAYLREYCNIHSVPIHVLDVSEPSGSKKLTEEQARDIRYDYFKDIASQYNYNKLMTAHHLGDQTETVLMRLSRGTGPKGAVGIREESSYHDLKVVRPFLSENKVDLRKYCDDNKIRYFIDSTNLENDFTRNRIRNEIIPEIEAVFPDFSKSLSSFTSMLEAENTVVEDIVDFIIRETTKSKSYGIEIDLRLFQDNSALFKEMHLDYLKERSVDFILSETVREILSRLGGFKDMSKGHVLEILDFFSSNKNGELQLPNKMVALKSGNTLLITKTALLPRPFGSYKIKIEKDQRNKTWDFEREGSKLSVEEVESQDIDFNRLKKENAVALNTDLLGKEFDFRKRESDDEVFLSGMSGSKKLSRYMIDKKIPKFLRDSLPVLTKNNTVLWIPGYYLHRDLTVNKDHKKAIVLKYSIQGIEDEE